MKKRMLSILLCCVVLGGLLLTAVFAEGSTAPADITGSGASDDPYLIYTAAGLKAFRDKVNGQNGLAKQPGAHARLMNDIVLNDGTFDEDGNYTPGESGKDAEQWTPIGSESNPYSGTVDGNGKTIKGLYVNVNGENSAGLFGYTDGATIKNVTVDGYVSISSENGQNANVAGIVACAINTSIADCTNLCTVKSDSSASSGSFAGGIVGNILTFTAGKTECSITNCRNGGKVIRIANDNSQFWIGGIAGEASVPVSGCYNTGSITANCSNTEYAYSSVGGVVGMLGSDAVLNGCYNTGAVTVEGDFTVESEIAFSVGGIAGKCNVNNTISNCYNVGKVTYTGNCEQVNSGGIMGINAISTVTDCYYLTGTAEKAVGLEYLSITTERAEAKTKTAFADGTVLALLKQNDTTGAWGECGYLAAAGRMVPLLDWQAADSHEHSEETGNCTNGIFCECWYPMHAATSEHNWSAWQHLTTAHTRHCQNPGCGITETKNCSDENKDHKCDTCEAVLSRCADENKDHKCDLCGKMLSAHTGGTATCTGQAVCEICGEKYGNKNANNHTGTAEWVTTRNAHEKKYNCCGEVTVVKKDHKWENGVCTACGYTCAHTGGTATCTDQAICKVCGEKYGELDSNHHADLKHTDAEAATTTAEGNSEYWHCEGCNKYFADKGGTAEIAKADTVTAKLPDDSKSDNSRLVLWIALPLAFGGAATAGIIYVRKKKHGKSS